MRTPVIAIIAATAVLFSLPAAAAEKSHRNQNIGVSSGAIIGAVAAGPVGAIVGAAIGAKVGDKFDDKNVQIASLETDVDNSGGQVARLERDLDALGAELDRLNELARPELLDLMQAEGVQPNAHTVTTIINACTQLQDLERGVAVLHRMVSARKPLSSTPTPPLSISREKERTDSETPPLTPYLKCALLSFSL